MTALHDRTAAQDSARLESARQDSARLESAPLPISGVWTLTLLVGLLVVTGVVSMFLHDAAAAVCLVVGALITVGVVPVMIAVRHARGHDDVP